MTENLQNWFHNHNINIAPKYNTSLKQLINIEISHFI